MASIITILDTRRKDANGNYPAKIVITHNQTNANISLNISLPEKQWIKNGLERPVKSSCPGAKTINDQIQALYIEFRKRISDLELSGWTKNVKASDIKRRILDERSVSHTSEVLFSDYADKYAQSCKSVGTGRNYRHTLSKLKVYMKKENIRFEDITF